MNRHAVLLGLAAALLLHDLFASARTDSIVAFLGGAHAKFVWQKWAWCNENYSPKSEAAAKAEGWSLELMDTRDGTQRTLATGLKAAHMVRMSRLGKWATYIEGTSTYIVDLTAASPIKKVLMSKSDCSYWAVATFWVDPANGTEYVYCLENANFEPIDKVIGGGNGIYKVKLNSNGTVDHSTATRLTINGLSGNPSVDVSVSVSADGKKLGGAFPWPDTKILDIAAGRLDMRHHEGFGCQSNLAPDNSYRFFHCEGDHLGIYMFAADMDPTNWFVDLRKNLDGFPTTSSTMDFLAPRWTNHVQYYTASWPMGDNAPAYVGNGFNYMGWDEMYAEDGSLLWTKDANWVKNEMDMDKVTKFYVGKFSSDFKTQEKSILIAADPRYFQGRGDAWICNGTTYGNRCGTMSTSRAIRGDEPGCRPAVRSGVVVNTEKEFSTTVGFTNAQGRQVRPTSSGPNAVDARDLAIGACIPSARRQGKRSTYK